jgi:hypothetical protein
MADSWPPVPRSHSRTGVKALGALIVILGIGLITTAVVMHSPLGLGGILGLGIPGVVSLPLGLAFIGAGPAAEQKAARIARIASAGLAGTASGFSASYATDAPFSITVHNFLRSPPGQCRVSSRHAVWVQGKALAAASLSGRYSRVKSVDNGPIAVDKWPGTVILQGTRCPMHWLPTNG